MKLLDKFRLDLLEKFPRSTYEEFSVEFLDEFSKKKAPGITLGVKIQKKSSEELLDKLPVFF